MKFILCFYYNLLFCSVCFSQTKISQFVNLAPDWINSNPAIIIQQQVSSESVFLYNKRKNNHDSLLIMTQYFDSLGNIIERDEYFLNKKGISKITNFSYVEDLLLKKEIISNTMFEINGSSIGKDIIAYEYDSLDNNITEKKYSYFGNSLKNLSITILNKEYNTKGHLIKEFQKLPYGGEFYLYHSYVYENGILGEIKSFDTKQNWIYSDYHEYDTVLNTESVFLINAYNERRLLNEFFYDSKKSLIEKKDYTGGHLVLDHSTQVYLYDSNGLIESQSFRDIRGITYYYKHFYSNK
jgi:hypothetical protein